PRRDGGGSGRHPATLRCLRRADSREARGTVEGGRRHLREPGGRDRPGRHADHPDHGAGQVARPARYAPRPLEGEGTRGMAEEEDEEFEEEEPEDLDEEDLEALTEDEDILEDDDVLEDD